MEEPCAVMDEGQQPELCQSPPKQSMETSDCENQESANGRREGEEDGNGKKLTAPATDDTEQMEVTAEDEGSNDSKSSLDFSSVSSDKSTSARPASSSAVTFIVSSDAENSCPVPAAADAESSQGSDKTSEHQLNQVVNGSESLLSENLKSLPSVTPQSSSPSLQSELTENSSQGEAPVSKTSKDTDCNLKKKTDASSESTEKKQATSQNSQPSRNKVVIKKEPLSTTDSKPDFLPKREDKNSAKIKREKTVFLSNEVLQSIITLRMQAFLKTQKQVNMEKLQLRTRGMQTASNLWKETAKHLERSVLELTSLNQKLESRKAHLLAVKRLASKSVAVQVGEESPTATNTTLSPRVAAQPFLQPSTHRRPGRPPGGSLQGAHLQNGSAQEPPAAKFQDPSPKGQGVNLIDLTDDEDALKNGNRAAMATALDQSANKLNAGRMMAMPGNGYITHNTLLQAAPNSFTNGSVQPAHNSQFVPQGNTAALAGPQYQMVPVNSSPMAQQSGSHMTMAGSPAGNAYLPSGHPMAPRAAVPQMSSPASAPGGVAAKTASLSLPPSFLLSNKHPAPLPSNMDAGNAPPTAKKRPPKPNLKISRVSQGIVLSWNMPSLSDVEKIAAYQLYAYQESESTTPRASLWKKVGEVAALPLPMACTLTQFQEGNKYHFAVRAIDQYGRNGTYSDPSSIYLGSKA